MKSILVVDDDTRLRDLLSEFLVAEGYEIVAAENAEEARKKLEKGRFDMMIVDVMMPGEDGVSLTHSIRKENAIPILMLTAMGEVDDRIKGLESGADDYLTKPFEPRELLLRIESILRRAIPKTPAESITTKFGPFEFNGATGELRQSGTPVFLTSTEIRLMEIFTQNIGKAVTREDVSKRLNGISERSVDVQVTRLRKKLEEDPRRPNYLQSVWGQGYILRPLAE